MSQIEDKEKNSLDSPRPITSHGVTYIPNATLTPDEKDRIWQAAKAYANHLHNQD